MGEQRLHSALAPIDVLTRLDLETTLTHKMDTFIKDWYRGEDYIEYNGSGGNTSPFTIPGADSGYAWSVKLLSVIASAAATVNVYLGDSTNTAPIGSQVLAAGGPAIFTWTSNVVVAKDQRGITVSASAGTLGIYKLQVKQVPAEMVGKL